MPMHEGNWGDFGAVGTARRTVAPYAKAIVGALIAFCGAVAVGYSDNAMTAAEWWFSGSSGLTALGLVFGVPNSDPHGEHQDESVQPPPEDGYGAMETVILGLFALILLFVLLSVAGLR